jgi:hypothetical protein
MVLTTNSNKSFVAETYCVFCKVRTGFVNLDSSIGMYEVKGCKPEESDFDFRQEEDTFLHSIQICCGAHPAFHEMGTAKAPFPWSKSAGVQS